MEWFLIHESDLRINSRQFSEVTEDTGQLVRLLTEIAQRNAGKVQFVDTDKMKELVDSHFKKAEEFKDTVKQLELRDESIESMKKVNATLRKDLEAARRDNKRLKEGITVVKE